MARQPILGEGIAPTQRGARAVAEGLHFRNLAGSCHLGRRRLKVVGEGNRRQCGGIGVSRDPGGRSWSAPVRYRWGSLRVKVGAGRKSSSFNSRGFYRTGWTTVVMVVRSWKRRAVRHFRRLERDFLLAAESFPIWLYKRVSRSRRTSMEALRIAMRAASGLCCFRRWIDRIARST